MFKMQDLKLELSDPEMYRMIQPNIRGSICLANDRYSRANNKYIGLLYRPDESESFIMYIDAINLLGLAMSQALLFSDFEWLSDEQLPEAEAARTIDHWLTTVRFLDSNGRYIRELARIKNFIGVPDPPAREDIKPNSANIFEVDLE